MLLIIGIVLAAFWLLGMVVFKITKGLIHIVLVIALVLLTLHFLNGPR